jgi:hypothetical protein
VKGRPLRWIPVIVLVNALLFIFGRPSHADEIEVFPDVLLPSELPFTSPIEDDPFSPRFGIRKGRGFQLVKPIEMNERKYEFNLSGPVVKSKTKKKSFGLNFEFRF